jgi:hypothetical protein
VAENNEEGLSAPEIVMLVEGLDALIRAGEGNDYWLRASEEERERWMPYRRLRARLKQAVHMSFYDNATRWLDSELYRERLELTQNLLGRLTNLLRDEKATRRSIREGFIAAMSELREVRQSKPKPLA